MQITALQNLPDSRVINKFFSVFLLSYSTHLVNNVHIAEKLNITVFFFQYCAARLFPFMKIRQLTLETCLTSASLDC